MDLVVLKKIESSILNDLGYIVRLEKKNWSKNIASDVFTFSTIYQDAKHRSING